MKSDEIPYSIDNLTSYDAQIVGYNHNQINDDLANSLRNIDDELNTRPFNTKLAAIRSRNPFLEIIPFPDKVVTLSLASNVPIDFNIPAGTQFIRFSSQSNYYISINGNAKVPDVADNSNNEFNTSMYKPEGIFFFCEGLQSVSCVSPSVGQVVTMWCYTQL